MKITGGYDLPAGLAKNKVMEAIDQLFATGRIHEYTQTILWLASTGYYQSLSWAEFLVTCRAMEEANQFIHDLITLHVETEAERLGAVLAEDRKNAEQDAKQRAEDDALIASFRSYPPSATSGGKHGNPT